MKNKVSVILRESEILEIVESLKMLAKVYEALGHLEDAKLIEGEYLKLLVRLQGK